MAKSNARVWLSWKLFRARCRWQGWRAGCKNPASHPLTCRCGLKAREAR